MQAEGRPSLAILSLSLSLSLPAKLGECKKKLPLYNVQQDILLLFSLSG